MSPIRVMIVDDHALLIEGLERLLQLESRIQVVGRAQSLQEATVLLGRLTPDVIVLDLGLPDSRDERTVKSIRALCASAKIVVLTGASRVTEAEVQRLGAVALLDKQTASDLILRTILGLFASEKRAERAQVELTARELEVARLAAEGMTNAEIARSLFISENTVKTHVASVLSKLDLRHRVDLARLYNSKRQS